MENPQPSCDDNAEAGCGWVHPDVFSVADGEAGNWPAGHGNSQNSRT